MSLTRMVHGQHLCTRSGNRTVLHMDLIPTLVAQVFATIVLWSQALLDPDTYTSTPPLLASLGVGVIVGLIGMATIGRAPRSN